MDQPQLFYEDILEAARQTALMVGRGNLQAVGHALKPHMTPDAAGRWLADALNPGKSDVLSAQQLVLIGQIGHKHGIHTTAAQFNRDTGYAEPTPIEPEDELAALHRQFIEAVGNLERLTSRIKVAEGRAT